MRLRLDGMEGNAKILTPHFNSRRGSLTSSYSSASESVEDGEYPESEALDDCSRFAKVATAGTGLESEEEVPATDILVVVQSQTRRATSAGPQRDAFTLSHDRISACVPFGVL